MPGDEPRPVSGFGHLRVNAWLAAHRSLTQPSHVLHRLSTPRHPPGTLSNLTTFPSRSLARELVQVSVIRGDHIPEVVKDHLADAGTGALHLRSSVSGRSGEDPSWTRWTLLEPSTRPWRRLLWWRRQDSNLRPPACKAGALPLSYAPSRAAPLGRSRVVGLCGLEPQTLRLSGVRSNHLSYRPVAASRRPPRARQGTMAYVARGRK